MVRSADTGTSTMQGSALGYGSCRPAPVPVLARVPFSCTRGRSWLCGPWAASSLGLQCASGARPDPILAKTMLHACMATTDVQTACDVRPACLATCLATCLFLPISRPLPAAAGTLTAPRLRPLLVCRHMPVWPLPVVASRNAHCSRARARPESHAAVCAIL